MKKCQNLINKLMLINATINDGHTFMVQELRFTTNLNDQVDALKPVFASCITHPLFSIPP